MRTESGLTGAEWEARTRERGKQQTASRDSNETAVLRAAVTTVVHSNMLWLFR